MTRTITVPDNYQNKNKNQETLNYLKGLMDENERTKENLRAYEMRINALEGQLKNAENLNKQRISEIDKWHALADNAFAEISMWQSQYEKASSDLDKMSALYAASKNDLERMSALYAVAKKESADKDAAYEAAKRYLMQGAACSDVEASLIPVNAEAEKKKTEALEKKIKKLQDKLGNETVSLSTLAEGLKDYADEAGIDKAHDVFNHLNSLLISVPAWTKNVPQLKKFFREYNKNKSDNRITVGGDLVTNKHVDHEVNGVAAGATGIIIRKG